MIRKIFGNFLGKLKSFNCYEIWIDLLSLSTVLLEKNVNEYLVVLYTEISIFRGTTREIAKR